MESSTRILLLGLDSAGSVIQSDRNAEALLAGRPGGLHGALLEDVVPGGAAPLAEALRSGRERTVMLPVGSAAERETGVAREAVVTVHPMSPVAPGMTACPAALAVIRMPAPLADRFVDPAVTRRALLEDGLPRIGATLDLELLARGLMDVLVPHFCNSGALLLLESLVDAEEPPASGTPPLRRMALASDDGDSAWDATFPTGEVLVYPSGTPHERCLLTGEPVLTVYGGDDAMLLAEKWGRPPVADLLKGTSMLLLPVRLDDSDRPGAAGFFVCTRDTAHRPFDAYDIEIGMEFAARAARSVDGARRYGRERATALTLQRSLLPTGLSAPSSVEVHHRYLPGSRLVEVGGDWYESIALPGGRVALVVGDVAGHGVRAAVTMGRLRTAIHTLAGLDLPPAEALERLDLLMSTLGEREPHFATCAYVVYDAVTGRCEVASAGHLPPLLAAPGAPATYLDVPPAPPLGVGDGPIASREFTVEDGTLLFLYTDGLVENRGRDIDDGLARLRRVFDRRFEPAGPGALGMGGSGGRNAVGGLDAAGAAGAANASDGSQGASLHDLCDGALGGVFDDRHRDDIAMLVARLSRIPESHHVSWDLPADPAAVRRARGLVRDRLARWNLSEMADSTALLASELVTNAIRHAGGRVTLRLVREGGLLCEVLDSSDGRPRVQGTFEPDDAPLTETGRGLHVVGRLARRWGVRRTATGKAVWCEQALP